MKTCLLASTLALLAACSGEAVCPGRQAACGGTCTAVLTDVQNCGACGRACGPGRTCSEGECRCTPGLAICGDACVDLASDPDHCGACDSACAPELFCTTSAGATACAASCAEGQTACGRACVDLDASLLHCGACGRACGTNERCIDQQCMADLYLACGNTNQVAEATLDLAPAGTTHTVGITPFTLAWLGDRLYSANAFGGTVSELRFDLPAPNPVDVSRTFTVDGASAAPDIEYVAAADGLLYVSNAALANLDVLDAASGKVMAAAHLDPEGTDAFTSPAGIALANGKAYVALNGADAIAVVDVAACRAAPPACGAGGDCSALAGSACVNDLCVPVGCATLLGRIALPASLASTASGPTPYRLLAVGDRLYASLQNLDRTNGYALAGEGRLAVVDLATDTLLQDGSGPLAVSLAPCVNPGEMVLDGASSTLYVACGYYDYFGTKSKSGMSILPISLAGATPAPQAPVPTENVLGSIAACGGAIFAGATDEGSVVRYDPATGSVSARELCPPDANGNAFVADVTCRP